MKKGLHDCTATVLAIKMQCTNRRSKVGRGKSLLRTLVYTTPDLSNDCVGGKEKRNAQMKMGWKKSIPVSRRAQGLPPCIPLDDSPSILEVEEATKSIPPYTGAVPRHCDRRTYGVAGVYRRSGKMPRS